MKPLNYIEVQQICTELNKLTGTQLQRVSSDEHKIYLLFWDGEKSYVWIIDLNTKSPMILPFDGSVPRRNIKKPWVSFLDMHFSGSILVGAQPESEGERSLVLSLKSVDKGEQKIIVNLFPKGVNLILKSENKQVSKFKVKDFPPVEELPAGLNARAINELVIEYNSKAASKVKNSLSPQQLHEKEVRKIEKAIKKITEDLERKNIKIIELKKLGEFIKANHSLSAPEELQKYIDTNKSVFENMSLAFDKSKKEKSKLEGSSNRLIVLTEQLQLLNQVADFSQWAKSKGKQTTSELKLKKDQKLKFKTINLENNHKVLLGSSAKNNSELIKASKPWYIWMHLRDYPSSHAVVISKKNDEVQRMVLIKAGQELIKHNFKSKKIKYEGLKFDLIYCQIRHLRQIKSSPGKVTYTNDKNLTIQM